MNQALAQEIIAHHLRLFGVGKVNEEHGVILMVSPREGDVAAVRAQAAGGGVVIAVLPDPAFLAAFGVTEAAIAPPPVALRYCTCSSPARSELKSLHPAFGFRQTQGESIVVLQNGMAVWFWLPLESGGIVVIGTDLAGDLLRYRQGDPACADNRPTQAMWGIAGERPNYLFESQLSGEDGTHRHADWWAMALAETVAGKLRKPLADMLPGGAPGAVIVTGDDDQAYLEKYDEQLKLLGDTPITYLLHPLTRHTQKSMRVMRKRNPGVDFGIHPDAIEAPERYGELFDEQVAWYRKLTGGTPTSLRNHGFLNDGYWGHLEAWLKHGVRISSNLPGFDGRVLNGSLLPARMTWRGTLTPHWSVLTVIGDGVRFASDMSDEDAAERVRNVADGIRQSGIPGVMVLNLHPQNVTETRAMHHAAMEIIRSGFVAWNLRQCWEWFQQRDDGRLCVADTSCQGHWFGQQWRKLQGWLGQNMAGVRS